MVLEEESIHEKLSRERKKLQKEGELPEWFTTQAWQMFKDKFSHDGETFKGACDRISSTLCQYTDDQEKWQKTFFDLLWKGHLAASTPVLANTGTNRGCSVSCSGNYVADNVYDFYESQKEVAVLSQNGFGTASYLGDIRPRGASISRGGTASGILPVLRGFVNVARDISQGSQRRGAWAGYIPIDHPDFWEVVDFVKNNPDDCNIGWNVSNEFINRLNNGDEDALSRYRRALKVKCVTGKGYFFFVDKANEQNPPMYKEFGLSVKSSQLCVTSDQRVVSDRGLLTAGELYDQGGKLALFDNDKVVNASKMKLIEKDADVYKITLENGLTHKVTPYHKVKTNEGMVSCENLKIGQKVAFQTNKGLFGTKNMEDEAFLLGMYQSDGTQYKGSIYICVWEDNFDLIPEIEERFERVCNKYNTQYSPNNNRTYDIPKFNDTYVGESVTGTKVKKKSLISRALKKALNFEKGYIPDWIYESDEKTQWQYIRGLFYCDGTLNVTNGKGNPIYLSINNINKEFLQELQILLLNLGVRFSLGNSSYGGKQKLPNGQGGYDFYMTQPCYRLVCGNKPDALKFDRNTGFIERKGKYVEDREYRDNTKKLAKVKSIEHIGQEDVFCVKVNSDEHLWVCNGIITSNCSEIALHSDEDHTFSCVLSSLNLAKWDEFDEHTIFNSTVFLDCVAQDFIEKGSKIRGLGKVVRFTEKARALGLGALGFHTYLQQNEIPLESLEAQYTNTNIFKKIDEESLKASKWMAENWGEPEWCKDFGLRNTHRLAVAPNTTSALICGSVSQGIEPVYKNVFTQGSATGELRRINPVLISKLEEKGKYNDEVIKDIIHSKGSVQHLDFLSDDEKLVFKTAFEIDQKTIVRLASQRQKYIDQGQSLNLFFAADEDEEYISEVHKEAFLDPRIKALYYLRSESGVQTSKECLSCEG